MKMLNQLLRAHQRLTAAAVLTVGFWLIMLYTPMEESQLDAEVFRAGLPTMFVGSAATLNWMGLTDAILLYPRSGKRRRHPGTIALYLRAALQAYGSFSLLMLSWWIFGYFTDSFASAKTLLLVNRLHLALLVALYYYIEDGRRPVRWRRNLLKKWYRLPTYHNQEDI